MFEPNVKTGMRREVNDSFPEYSAYFEMYTQAATVMEIKNPPAFHVVLLTRLDEDGEIYEPRVAQIAEHLDGTVVTQISTGLIEAYKDKKEALMGVFAHELSHYKNKDISSQKRAFWVTFAVNICLWLALLAYIGAPKHTFTPDKPFRPMTTESVLKDRAVKLAVVDKEIRALKAAGKPVPISLTKEAKHIVKDMVILDAVWGIMVNFFLFYTYGIFAAMKVYLYMFPGTLISWVIAEAIRLETSRPAEFRADEDAARVVGSRHAIEMLEEFNYEDRSNALTRLFWDTHPSTTARINRIEILEEAGLVSKHGVFTP